MPDPSPTEDLPPIPGKRYFTIGEVSTLCDVKPYVLRYWEQEFNELEPVKRRGNRRYYQRRDIIVIRRIRALVYEQGFTLDGARRRLAGSVEKRDHTESRQVVRQTISELEDVLRILKSSRGDGPGGTREDGPARTRQSETPRTRGELPPQGP